MKAACVPALFALTLANACGPAAPEQKYGFVTLLGRDTIAVESVSRRGNAIHVEAVDRFPRVRRRHADILLDSIGGVRHLVMDIETPSEPEKERNRRVVADVSHDSVRITKKDDSSTVQRAFATGGAVVVAHVPQMYTLYERYFETAHNRKKAGDTAQIRQFYIDREFDRFPLHTGTVRLLADNKAEVRHDWLSGTGDAVLDSAGHLLSYSGARTTYQVTVTRVATTPDIDSTYAGFRKAEAAAGQVTQLSPRGVAYATIGTTDISIDYGRPMARGRVLLGGVVPYGNIWRTGANAATQLKTSGPITVGGVKLAAGTYTLWTLPKQDGVTLIINGQSGQWGTDYDYHRDIGTARLQSDSLTAPVEQFTISVVPADPHHGSLQFAWGSFRWSAPIVVP